jgi:hypothetical protein
MATTEPTVITEDMLTPLEKHWLALGYVSVRVAAARIKRGTDAIYRAIRAKDLELKMDGSRRFVSMSSLIKWIGPEAAKTYGLIAPKKGA